MKFDIFDKYIHLSIVLLIINNVKICFSFNLTVLHNNDFHTHFEPINEFSSECKSNELCYGGVARTVAKVKEIRGQNVSNVLFLNAGDHYQGTIWYTFLRWKGVAQFVKLMEHDAMALGNHEFDDGVEGLVPFIRNMSFGNRIGHNLPILSCNIDASNEPDLKDLINKSIIKVIDNRKVAIIGYITPQTTFLSRPGKNLIFNDEIDSIRNEIKKLKDEHEDSLNIFIAVGHSGFEKDKEIAEKIPELDIVVGGHTNTFLYTGEKPPSIEIPEDKYPVVFDHGSDGKTLVVQAFAYGKYLGKLDVVFDDNGKVVEFGGNPILLDSNTIEDPETLIQVNERKAEIEEEYNNIIGSSLVMLSSSECREGECNLGNVIADAFVNYYIESTRKTKISWTSAPIALINGGSIRNSIMAGSISMKDIMSTSPFGNKVGILKINGSTLWKILEHSGSQYKLGGFMQVSGLRIEYDLSKSPANRLQKVRVRCADCLIPHYEDIDLMRTYAIVITDYIVMGGDNYTMMDPNDFIDQENIDSDVFSEFIKKYSPIYTGLEDRILFTSEKTDPTSEITDPTSEKTDPTSEKTDPTSEKTDPNFGPNIHINNGFVTNLLLCFSIYLYFIAYNQRFE